MNKNQTKGICLMALALSLPSALNAQSMPRSQAVLDQILAPTPRQEHLSPWMRQGVSKQPERRVQDTRPVPRAVKIEADLMDPLPLEGSPPNARAMGQESSPEAPEFPLPPSTEGNKSGGETSAFNQIPPMPPTAMNRTAVVREIGDIPAPRHNLDAFVIPGESPQYASMSAWSNERVKVRLIRNASFAEALAALMPAGWTVDLSGVVSDLSDFRVDLTSTNARGTVISELLKELGLTGYPYVEFNTFVVASQ